MAELRIGQFIVLDDVTYGGAMNGVRIREADGDWLSGVELRGEEAVRDIHYALGRVIARIDLAREESLKTVARKAAKSK
jgi:hypothetical protein